MDRMKQNKVKKGGTAANIFVVIFAAVCFLLTFSIRWAVTTWSNLKMDELIYELTAPLEGTGGGMIGAYVLNAVVPTAVIVIFLAILLHMLKKKGKRLLLPRLLVLAISGAVFCAAFYVFWTRLDVGAYLSGQRNASSFIEDNYADPAKTELTFPEKKRNLIYIYLESMEVTFADEANGGAFSQNIIPELTELAKENEDFSGDSDLLNGGVSFPGSTWTMGAMFAQTSGLPLKVSIGTNNMDTMDSFFPDITTLGDILEKEGYDQRLLLGSNATFGGRRLYFTEHGGYKMEDYPYAKEVGRIPQDYGVFWGYEDEKLFEFAKETLTEMAAGDQPFNLTMLTVDTHFEDGYVCRLCGNEFGDNQYANVMACSSRQVTEFVDWIRQQDFYENTTVIISGDHPTMDSDFTINIDENYQRKVYTCYINSACEANASMGERVFSTFDAFPTTLAAMGVQIEGDRLGLGTNLYSDLPTRTEEIGISEESQELSRKSYFLETLEKTNLSAGYTDRLGMTPSAEVYFRSRDEETGRTTYEITNLLYLMEDLESVTMDVIGDSSEVTATEEAVLQENGSYLVTVTLTDEQMQNAGLAVHGYGASGEDYKLFTQNQSLYLTARHDAPEYFTALENLLDDCAVFFIVRDEGSKGMVGATREALQELGLGLEYEYRQSYCAVIDGDEIIEDASDERLETSGTLSDGTSYKLESGGRTGGDAGSVIINGTEYIDHKLRGLSAVVYNKKLQKVVDTIRFDTHIGEESGVVEIGSRNLFTKKVKIKVSDIKGCLKIDRSGTFDVKEVYVEYWDAEDPKNVMTASLYKGRKKVYKGSVDGSDFEGRHIYFRIVARNEMELMYVLDVADRQF